MSITAVNLTAGDPGSNGTSATTASITTTSGRLYMVMVNVYRPSGSTAPPQPTLTFNGSGLSFSFVTSVDADAAGTDRQTVFLFQGVASASSSGTITIDSSGVTVRPIWVVDEISGADTTSPIVQSATAAYASGATSGSVTLAAFADATNNAAYGAFGVQKSSAGSISFTAGTGFIKLGEDGTHVASTGATEYEVGQDTSVDMTWAAAGGGSIFRSGGIAVEIAAATGGTSVSREWDVTYDLLNSATRTWALTYDIIRIVAKQFTLVYDIQNVVAKQFTLVYDIQNVVAKQFTLVYDMAGSVAGEWALDYDIANTFSREWVIAYNLGNVVVVMWVEFVSASRGAVWQPDIYTLGKRR